MSLGARLRDGADRHASITDVTAIVVSYNEAVILKDAVDSLVAAGVQRILIWDNSDDLDARDAIARLDGGSVSVLSEGENLGFGTANNRAAEHAATEFVVFVNPDCRVDHEALCSMLEVLTASGDVGAVAPRMRYPDGSAGIAGGGRPSLLKELLAATRLDDLLPRRVRGWCLAALSWLGSLVGGTSGMGSTLARGMPVNVSWASGFCLMMRTPIFQAVGGFNEKFFLYFEDVELCDRVRGAGYSVAIDRGAEAVHAESATTGASGKSVHYWRGLATYFSVSGAPRKARLAGLVAKVRAS